jgi:hypothetical protein
LRAALWRVVIADLPLAHAVAAHAFGQIHMDVVLVIAV